MYLLQNPVFKNHFKPSKIKSLEIELWHNLLPCNCSQSKAAGQLNWPEICFQPLKFKFYLSFGEVKRANHQTPNFNIAKIYSDDVEVSETHKLLTLKC